MKMGWIKPRRPKGEEEEDDQFYQLWKDDDQVRGLGSVALEVLVKVCSHQAKTKFLLVFVVYS